MKTYTYNWLHGARKYSLQFDFPMKPLQIVNMIFSKHRLKQERNHLVLLNVHDNLLPYDDDEVILHESFTVRRLPLKSSLDIIHEQTRIIPSKIKVSNNFVRRSDLQFQVDAKESRTIIQDVDKIQQMRDIEKKITITCECCKIDVWNCDRLSFSKDYQNWSSVPCWKCSRH